MPLQVHAGNTTSWLCDVSETICKKVEKYTLKKEQLQSCLLLALLFLLLWCFFMIIVGLLFLLLCFPINVLHILTCLFYVVFPLYWQHALVYSSDSEPAKSEIQENDRHYNKPAKSQKPRANKPRNLIQINKKTETYNNEKPLTEKQKPQKNNNTQKQQHTKTKMCIYT